MRITFLDHSGFLVELPSATLLFDWWKGELPALRRDVPLVIFSSHWHEDHFSPAIFSLNADAYFLGDMDQRWLARKGASPEVLEKCRSMSGHETAELLGGVTVETLPSTDEGVAFLVTCDGKTVFHAGDLNWWHWNGEPDFFNDDIKRSYTTEIDKLKGEKIDVAFVPADLRLEDKYFWAVNYFQQTVGAEVLFPMHFWGRFDVCDLLRELGFANVMKITEENQKFEI